MISYSSDKAEQSRVGQADTSGLMDVGNVRGSEKDDEDWEDVGRNQENHEMLQLWIVGTHCQGLSRERQMQGRRESWRKRAQKGHSKCGGDKGGLAGKYKDG